jgi:glutamate carboxypeptidase
MNESVQNSILDHVGRGADDQLRFVEEICRVNSHTDNIDGVQRVADMILERAGSLFRTHEPVMDEGGRTHHILRSGGDGPAVYLLGHLDTVFPPGHPFQSCGRNGDWLTGPGTGDMKGGLAVIVFALEALAHAGAIDSMNLSMILGADEETGSTGSRAIYEREVSRAAACLTAECAGENGEFVVSRNGKAGGRLDCTGEQGHVGRGDGGKRSAILGISRAVIALESLNGAFPDVTVNVGRVSGGLGPSTVPGEAHCLFDLRWRDEIYFEKLVSEARRLTGDREPGDGRCRLTILNHRPAMPATEGTARLTASLELTAGSAGTVISTEHRRGTSDANFFGAAGVPAIDGFGPVCLDDHTERERILIPTLTSRTALLALFLAGHGPGLAPA